MRRVMIFTFGVLVGLAAATAWAHLPGYHRLADAPATTAAASMTPFELMLNAQLLAVEHHDAF